MESIHAIRPQRVTQECMILSSAGTGALVL